MRTCILYVAINYPVNEQPGGRSGNIPTHWNNVYDVITGDPFYDYHFMRQTNTGQWVEKHGIGRDSVLWDAGMTPDTIPWTLNGISYYDSDIIYYAIGEYVIVWSYDHGCCWCCYTCWIGCYWCCCSDCSWHICYP